MLYEEEAVVSTDKVWHPVVSTSVQCVNLKCLLDSGSDLNGISEALFESIKDKEGRMIMHDSGIKVIGATGKLTKSLKQEVLISEELV